MPTESSIIELTDSVIDVNRIVAHVTDPACGAEVLFVGTTRQWTAKKTIEPQGPDTPGPDTPGPTASVSAALESAETSHLVYECYREMALAQMRQLATLAATRWPIRRLALVHRLGRVDPMEASVAVAVSCPHRSEAFEAAKWLIDRLKHDVPIWKQEHYVQSGPEWIHPGSGSCRCGEKQAAEHCVGPGLLD